MAVPVFLLFTNMHEYKGYDQLLTLFQADKPWGLDDMGTEPFCTYQT